MLKHWSHCLTSLNDNDLNNPERNDCLVNILLVEDEKPLSDALCKILKKESLLVDAV